MMTFGIGRLMSLMATCSPVAFSLYNSVCPVPPCRSERWVNAERRHDYETEQPVSSPRPRFASSTTHLPHLAEGLDIVERVGEPDVDRLRSRPIACITDFGLGLGAGHRGFLDGRAASTAHAEGVYPLLSAGAFSQRTLAGAVGTSAERGVQRAACRGDSCFTAGSRLAPPCTDGAWHDPLLLC